MFDCVSGDTYLKFFESSSFENKSWTGEFCELTNILGKVIFSIVQSCNDSIISIIINIRAKLIKIIL